MDEQNRNLLLASVLSFLVIIIWFVLFPPPEATQSPSEAVSEQTIAELAPPSAGQANEPAAALVEATVTDAQRLEIKTDRLHGSLSLQGGRIDELALTGYRTDLTAGSPDVTLLRPVGQEEAYYSAFGWVAGAGLAPEHVPTPDTIWSLSGNDVLTTQTPVTLVWDNGVGQQFQRKISIDEDYMFTVEQTIVNNASTTIEALPYGLIRRHGEPSNLKNFFILHEGMVRLSDGELEEVDYDSMVDYDIDPRDGTPSDRIDVAENGWIGFTDHYWMTTLVPTQGQPFRSTAKYYPSLNIYQTEAVMPRQTIGAGASATVTTQFFAGAKEWETIRNYERAGVAGFLDSIDWGWFFFITKPMFAVLHWLNTIIGNMGWSIIGLTLLIKALLLPLAYKSYVSMAKMKELQPEMEKIKERAGDDRQKLQKDMMELYKKEKVNPAAGCLPMLLQIPIFFSLYKVIFVTLELRHAPWIGWIKDLSAPDPSSILNLFGLLPWGAPDPGSLLAFVSLGVLPILLGISMYLQQKLNPAPTDPTQAMIFAWMPWVFMFMLGTFASGLVVYWIANNTITFIQQYAIMRSQGYKPDILGNILGKKASK